MFKRKSTAFTLIELIATLVIMAIIALIVTPLVMNIIRKARVSADKRSIDAYGRSIELAIASHLLDTGKFATSIDELTIEYSGNKVECETTQINPDSSVYLSNCKVNNRAVTNYAYGTDKSPSYESYQIGDHVSYNNIGFYVIKDSGAKEATVTLLKSETLSAEEINQLGKLDAGCSDCYWYRANDDQGNYNNDVNNDRGIDRVINDWVKNVLNSNQIKLARSISFDELVVNLGYAYATVGTTTILKNSEITPSWVFSDDYWTMSSADDSNYSIWVVRKNGSLDSIERFGHLFKIRPVVELYKTATITKLES